MNKYDLALYENLIKNRYFGNRLVTPAGLLSQNTRGIEKS